MEGVPKAVADFLAEHIESVVQLEVLLMLYARAGQSFNAAQVAQELRIDPAWTEEALSKLQAAGILTSQHSIYTYSPRTPQLHDTITTLAHEYQDRRVTIISLIFAPPKDPIRQFTDAFRFRKEKEGGS